METKQTSQFLYLQIPPEYDGVFVVQLPLRVFAIRHARGLQTRPLLHGRDRLDVTVVLVPSRNHGNRRVGFPESGQPPRGLRHPGSPAPHQPVVDAQLTVPCEHVPLEMFLVVETPGQRAGCRPYPDISSRKLYEDISFLVVLNGVDLC